MDLKTIIALDFSTREEVMSFLDEFKEPVYAKVGMELFYSCGSSIVEDIKSRGHKIFLDLKLHDIPNTVKGGLKNLGKLGVDMINVHCAGGSEMIKAGLEGLDIASEESGYKRPLYIGVTQLTSTSQDAMNSEQGIEGDVLSSVLRYAKMGKEAGLDGVVCSVHESEEIHKICGDDFLTVTPGIRLADDSSDDQVRIATPKVAKEKGSSYIVVGRSITKSKTPEATYKHIEDMFS